MKSWLDLRFESTFGIILFEALLFDTVPGNHKLPDVTTSAGVTTSKGKIF